MLKNKLLVFLALFFLLFNYKTYAQNDSVVDTSTYLIHLYQPTYLMPFSYTSSFSDAGKASAPGNQLLGSIESKFQFSVKTTILKNIFNYKNSLELAYTQLSFWQLYNDSPFFRETNYQPEVFFKSILDKNFWPGWKLHSLNIGFIHDSNGRGGDYERSWNRIYGEAVLSNQNWMISIRPWYVIPGNSLENNRDIARFLGYERVIIAYKFHNQVFSLRSYNLEHIGSRASFELTWSFPLIGHVRGYTQLFSGYGGSLIDYNHYANSGSIGIALSDWV